MVYSQVVGNWVALSIAILVVSDKKKKKIIIVLTAKFM